MNWAKINQIIGGIILLTASFYLGYLFAVREIYSQKPSAQVAVAPNGFIENSLTRLDSRPIMGILDGNQKEYGELLFKDTGAGYTEIRIKIKNVPLNLVLSDNKIGKAVPNEMDIKLARLTKDGLDYDVETTGAKVVFENGKDWKSVDYSTMISTSLLASEVKEIVLESPDKNLFKINSPDLPTKVTEREAPYFRIQI